MTEEHWSSPNGCHPDCPVCAEGAEEHAKTRASRGMRLVKVRFTATFEATIEVPNKNYNQPLPAKAWYKDVADEIANIEIPENETCKYVEDTFEPETDKNGDPVVF